MSLELYLHESWRKPNALTLGLWPFSLIYRLLFSAKQFIYKLGVCKVYRAPVPVVVVGNITVGGTGKTPLVIYLVELLREYGYKPGVVSRGYSGHAEHYPMQVQYDTPVHMSGDEPALIVRRCEVPMVIGPDRRADIELLLAQNDVDIIVSDDGLQHFAMARDIEICLHDATRSNLNRHLLPAGPYREPVSRLDSVNLLVEHVSRLEEGALESISMMLEPTAIRRLQGAKDNGSDEVFRPDNGVHVAAGIGNPQRFFDACRERGWNIIEHTFPDHHKFIDEDFQFDDNLPIVMTEKDAVKCQQINVHRLWYIPVDVKISAQFPQRLKQLLENIKS
jgi:tetraacyldisaccharide 4'-kinase